VGRVLEPHRRFAVHDPLAEVWASCKERDRGSRRLGHNVGGHLGEQDDSLRTDLLNRPDAYPSRARCIVRGGQTSTSKADHNAKDCGERDEEQTSRRWRTYRPHPLIVPDVHGKDKTDIAPVYAVGTLCAYRDGDLRTSLLRIRAGLVGLGRGRVTVPRIKMP
jgi:hypothetical protein